MKKAILGIKLTEKFNRKLSRILRKLKQAGAELCKAQVQLG
jgi:hypothetical protein